MPSKLKKWIEDHPAAILLGVTISVGSAASTTTGYLTNQLHLAEKSEEKSKFISEKNEIETKYMAKIADLEGRLSSIERRVGSNQANKYFDIRTLQIPSSEIRNLPTAFKNYDNSSFFVNAPISGSWAYKSTTEGNVLKLGLFREGVEQLENQVSDKQRTKLLGAPVHVWLTQPLADVSFEIDKDQRIQGVLTPHVLLMKVTAAQFFEKLSALDEIQSQSESNRKSDAQAGKISDFRRKDNFEKLYLGDAAGFIFSDTLIRMLVQFGDIPNASVVIHSAQKQLNVMYIDAEIIINGVIIIKYYDDNCIIDTRPTVHLRREMFSISYGSNGYFIQTEVPTCDGRSKAFDWINQWLAGLRITALQ